MKIKTRCDNCGKVYNMASEYIGRTAQCKHCQRHFIMNPYDPAQAAGAFAAQPQTREPAQAAGAPSAFGGQSQGGQHPLADQTILPNAGGNMYAPREAAFAAAQTQFQMRPPLGGPRTQTALCLSCGHSVEIPVPSKRMKITCGACGAKIQVGPETHRNVSGGSASGGKTLLLLILLLILAGLLFVGPRLWPDIFPDWIGDFFFSN